VAGEAKPEDVNGCAGFDNLEVGGDGGGGVATVAADDESGGEGCGAVGGLDLDSGDAAALLDEAGDLVLHEEAEGGVADGFGGEEVEQVPLGHEGDVAGVGGEMGEVGDG
jgi:hypothetical protein